MVAELADPTTVVEHPLTRMQQLVADRDAVYSDAQNRERGDEPPPAWLIDGLLPIGVSIIIADPGAGKSYVVQQILHHLCYGRPLGDWDPPGLGGHLAWVIDLEGDSVLTRERGYAITPYGDLPEDGSWERKDNYLWYTAWVIPPPEREDWASFRLPAWRHIAYLDQALTDARAAGAPLGVVVIDTLSKFMGPRPPHANVYTWEAETVGELNNLAKRHGVAIVLVHHTNKAGEVSGSTGTAGSSTMVCKLDVTRPDDETGYTTAVLRSLKVRNGPAFAYPLVQNDDGTWTFTQTIGPAEAGAVGHKRAVLAELREGPRSRRELHKLGIGPSLGKVLDRLRREQVIRLFYGRWQLTPDPRRTRPGPGFSRCEACGEPMIVAIQGQRTHPGCPELELPPADEPAPVEPETVPLAGRDEYAEPLDETLQFNGFRLMKEALAASRMHPVPRIRESDRDAAPWTLIVERMTGEHRWTRDELPTSGMVAVFDRRGSYPSAASSTVVAANLLTHSGALDEPRSSDGKPLAGIFHIDPIPWVDPRIGHPLGRLADVAGDLWVTTPHLDLLVKLAGEGVIPAPVIRDSWTGRATGGLFSAFSRAVREAREQNAADPDAYALVKRRSSIALRSLWPKESRSPFWRPDWSVSIRAEASVRHWVRAWQAIGHGAELLSIGAVDEVVFVAPDDADSTWAPAPYVIGRRFGQVAHKDVKIGPDEHVASPLPAATWVGRQKGRRARVG